MKEKDITKCCICGGPMGGTYKEMEERSQGAANWFCSIKCADKWHELHDKIKKFKEIIK